MLRLAFALAAAGLTSGSNLPSNGETPLSLDRLLSAVYQDGRLKMSQRSETHVIWAGNDRILFTSPRSGVPRQILAASLNGTTRVIATGSGPRLSSDGRWLAYLDPAGGLVVADFGSGAARPVATLRRRDDSDGTVPNIGTTYAWQQGRNRLVYLRYRGRRGDSGSLGFVQLTQPEVRVFDPVTGSDRMIYSVSLPPVDDPLLTAQTAIGGIAMAKDGTLYLTEGAGTLKAGLSAYLKAVRDGRVRTIARVGNFALGRTPSLSPDGRTITMIVSRDPDYLTYIGTEYRAMIDRATGRTRILKGPYPTMPDPAWSANGDHVSYVCKTGPVADRLCVAGRSQARDRIEAPLDPLAELEAFAVSPDGRHIAWLSRDLTDTDRLKVSGGDGAAPRALWTDALVPARDLVLGETRPFRWKSTDGHAFEGLLTLPPGYQGGRLPLLVDIHGGPNGGVQMESSVLAVTPLEAQMWAGMGYAYFKADYREGFVGDRSPEMLRIAPGMTVYEVDARDVLAGIDALVDAGIADPKRIGAVGHSMGSVTLTSLLSITDRIAVAVAKEGVEDWSTMRGVRDPAGFPADLKSRMWAWRADSVEAVRRAAIAGSPMFHPEKIRTPILVIKSNPSADRIGDGRKFVDAVNEAGGQARLLTFPDDFHVTVREANSRRVAEESVAWINGHLGIAPPPP